MCIIIYIYIIYMYDTMIHDILYTSWYVYVLVYMNLYYLQQPQKRCQQDNIATVSRVLLFYRFGDCNISILNTYMIYGSPYFLDEHLRIPAIWCIHTTCRVLSVPHIFRISIPIMYIKTYFFDGWFTWTAIAYFLPPTWL